MAKFPWYLKIVKFENGIVTIKINQVWKYIQYVKIIFTRIKEFRNVRTNR